MHVIFFLADIRQLVEIYLRVSVSDAVEIYFVESLVEFGIGLKIFELDVLQRLEHPLVMTQIINFSSNILNLLLMSALDDTPQRVVLILKGSIHSFELS